MKNSIYYNQNSRPTSAFNINPNMLNYNVGVPISLAKSLEGKYFVGIASNMKFGEATNAWARLYNPPDSNVNLYVNVWTAGNVTLTPFRIQIWFNSDANGIIEESNNVTPSNTVIKPLPVPKIKLQYANGVKGFPENGIYAFGRNGIANETIVSEEEGKFIFPPGGSFLVQLSNPATPTQAAFGRVAFGWWEEPII
ncbi:MAG: DUF6143 family protein [Tissierellia bacterium]|nr:DUF6143 family protein [Tissierellia bacterium]